MIPHTEYQQGSIQWLEARAGIPTASCFKNLITPGFKPRAWTTEMPNTYLASLLSEWWSGRPAPSFNFVEGDLGHILEDEAKPYYTMTTGQEIQNVGFVTTDDGRIGCSPDGLIGEDGGLEVKCPEARTHVKYLLDGEVPDDYLLQVHGSIYVTGRPWWRFLSYRRNYPHLLIQVNRNDTIMEVIDEALQDFLERFERGKERLQELNGGPPIRPPKIELSNEPIRFSWEMSEDIVP